MGKVMRFSTLEKVIDAMRNMCGAVLNVRLMFRRGVQQKVASSKKGSRLSLEPQLCRPQVRIHAKSLGARSIRNVDLKAFD